ncbi:hypothetical protein [Devosia ginsengisoli]|uniref:hypothetical protein n=1 Tax=Devosia ginsengisoli TaxID=400770 RepID=UPI0026F05C4A|nr:hypothetical protein [Devosia ginsengisoli]MCR6673448.1 hypothetical protein [Devosia ginsengisoli]
MNSFVSGPRNTGRKMRHRLAATALVVAAVFGLAPSGAMAQDYPNQPITAIVPFGAGGGADTQTRIWGKPSRR